MSPDKLVYMANQIGKFFARQGASRAADGVAEHLLKFWAPRMRGAIVDYVDAGGEGVDPPVRAAIEKIKRSAQEAAQGHASATEAQAKSRRIP